MLVCRFESPSSIRDDQVDRGGHQDENERPHDPACAWKVGPRRELLCRGWEGVREAGDRSEEHTSELQSRLHLVWRLLLEKKQKNSKKYRHLVRELRKTID